MKLRQIQRHSDRLGRAFSLALVLGLLGASHQSWAIGFLLPNQDAAAIARGNAFVATADNPSAIYYNPAGITQIQGSELEVGAINYLGIDAQYHSPAGTQSNTRFQDQPSPQIYYVFSPTNSPLAFGLGLYAPFGLGVKWPENSGFRSIAIDSKLLFITVNPVVAWQITKSLSLSVGPTINYAQIKFNRGLLSSSDDFVFKGDDFDFGLTAGLLWQPHPQWSFGLDYRLATTMDFKGTSTYSPAPGSSVASASTTASIPFPQTVSAGVSFRPTSDWNFEADVDYINWQPLGTVTLAGTKNLFGSDLALALNWHDSWQFKFGATRRFDNGWYVSAGYFFSTDTASDANFTPAIPDTALHVGSLGFGRKGEHWDWALAGQILAGPERTIIGGAGNSNPVTTQSAAGKYSLFIPTVTFSVAYRF
jgi:long-chain fatty acid transport protein